MESKIYLKLYCDSVKKNVMISYTVYYQNLTPCLGENRCEYRGNLECAQCPMKQLRRNMVFDHFEDVYKKLPIFFVLENNTEVESN